MPIISVFYGIIVQMFNEAGGQHHAPHIHVEYGSETAVYDLQGNVLKGSLPANKHVLLHAWITLHEDELIANWSLLSKGETPMKIEGLK